MKKIIYLLFTSMLCLNTIAQVTDPCSGAGASQPIDLSSPCNCSEAQAGTPCNKSVFTSQVASDNAIHTFLTTQNGYALPTTPVAWQDLRANNMFLDISGIWKHEVSTEFTTGPGINVIDVFNIVQVRNLCAPICQDYKIILKTGGTCGTNTITPVLITSTLDATVKYRQYSVTPNTTYIISRQMYFDGNNIDCYIPWTGTDGISATGAKITAQHWFIWSTVALPVNNLQFSAKQLNNAVMLQWRTEQEFNTSKFEIERSSDAISFTTIGEATAAGSSATEKNYWIEDRNPMAVNFYRVKSIDRDGRIAYSPVAKILLKAVDKSVIIINPNPVKEKANIVVESNTSVTTSYKIINTNGQAVQNGKILLQKGINTISKDVTTLNSGMYLFVTEVNSQTLSVKFIK